MQPRRERVRRTAKRHRCTFGRKTLPRSETQHLTIPLAQPLQRPRKLAVAQIRCRGRSPITRKTLHQSETAPITTALIREHASRAPQQPRQRVTRHLVQPPPRNNEHLTEHVVGRRCVRTPQRVRQHRRGMLHEQHLDPHPPLRLQHRHTDTMSGTRREITARATDRRGRSGRVEGQRPRCRFRHARRRPARLDLHDCSRVLGTLGRAKPPAG